MSQKLGLALVASQCLSSFDTYRGLGGVAGEKLEDRKGMVTRGGEGGHHITKFVDSCSTGLEAEVLDWVANISTVTVLILSNPLYCSGR